MPYWMYIFLLDAALCDLSHPEWRKSGKIDGDMLTVNYFIDAGLNPNWMPYGNVMRSRWSDVV